MLETICKIWEKIHQLPRWVIEILLFIVLVFGPRVMNKQVAEEVIYTQEKIKAEKEEYAIEANYKIYSYLKQIKNSDPHITNVMVLQFHNSKESLSRYSFLYLSATAEEYTSKRLAKSWEGLNRHDEMDMIHSLGCLEVHDPEQIMDRFPKLALHLKEDNLKHVTLYALETRKPLGFLMVVYDNNSSMKDKQLMIPLQGIANEMSVLLDYGAKMK